MKPHRILMTADAVGGVWNYACDLSTALRPLGVEVVLAVLGPAPTAAQRTEIDDALTVVDTSLDLDWLAPDAASVEAAGVEIATLAQQLNVDVVHLNQAAFAALAPFSMPVVTTIHSCVATWWQAVHGGDAPASFNWQTDLVCCGLRRSNAIVAPSAAFAEAVRRTYALEEAPHVVPNGRQLLPGKRAAQENSVFTAGRLWDKGKDIATLDRVAARLSHPFRAAGPVRGPHDETIALHNLEALGSLDGAVLAARLARRPIFVSAAVYEPFGLAVLEAASAGCALVLADIATFRETWNGAALFVARSDEDGFVAAIEALIANGEWRASMGERASVRAAQFTPSRMAAGMQAVYARALASRDVAVRTAAA